MFITEEHRNHLIPQSFNIRLNQTQPFIIRTTHTSTNTPPPLFPQHAVIRDIHYTSAQFAVNRTRPIMLTKHPIFTQKVQPRQPVQQRVLHATPAPTAIMKLLNILNVCRTIMYLPVMTTNF